MGKYCVGKDVLNGNGIAVRVSGTVITRSFVHHHSFVHCDITSLFVPQWCQFYFYFLMYNIGHDTINKNQVKQPCICQEKIKGEGYEILAKHKYRFREKYRHWDAYRSILNCLYSYNDEFLLRDYGPEIGRCGTIGKRARNPRRNREKRV